jgi:hypothetical protein
MGTCIGAAISTRAAVRKAEPQGRLAQRRQTESADFVRFGMPVVENLGSRVFAVDTLAYAVSQNLPPVLFFSTVDCRANSNSR